MIKKSLMLGVGTILLGAIVFGSHALSYLRTSIVCVRDRVHDSVPVSFEIERARRMIEDLKPEIQQNMHRIAREEVEVTQLQDQLKGLQKRQDTTRQAVLRLKSDLESGHDSYQYANKTYTVAQVRSDLANRFERCRTLDETVANLSKVVDFRTAGLNAGRKKLDELLTARDQLQLDVEGLQARHKMIEVQQTASDLQIDDSRLSRTKGLVTDIQTRLQVAEQLLATAGEFVVPQIELETPEHGDLLGQIAEYFGQRPPSAVVTPAAEIEQLAEVMP